MRQLKTLLLGILLVVSFGTVTLAAPAYIVSFADIIEPLMPTVVNVYTVKYNNQAIVNNSSLPEIIPFEQFNVPFSFKELHTSLKVISLESKFIVGEDGYIITNNHVVASSNEIYVKLSNDTELLANIIGTNFKTDLILLKIDTQKNYLL